MAAAIYAEYKSHIRALMVEYGRQGILKSTKPIRFVNAKGIPPHEGGVVVALDPRLSFRDGATLSVLEEVRVINSEPNLLRYSYHYERPNGYFFHYEREETSDLIRKPEYHMPVVLNLPHFNASPVDLEIILKLIVANFYSPDVYSKQIIGQEIHLTV